MLAFSIAISWLAAALEHFDGTQRLVVVIPYALVVPLVLLVPRAAYRYLRSAVTPLWLASIERLQLYIFALNAPASLWFHHMGFQYDRYLHFMVGALLVPYFFLWYVAIRRRIAPRYMFRIASFILMTAYIGIVSVFAWELYQHTVDTLFGTQLFFDSRQPITVDFWEDIFFGLLGMCVGFIYLRAAYDRFSRCFSDGVSFI